MMRLSRWVIVCVLPAVSLLATTIPVAASSGIIGTPRGKVYHTYPVDCSAAKRIQDDNKIVFASVEEAETAGRRLCKLCAELALKAKERGDLPEPRDRATARSGGDSGVKRPTEPVPPTSPGGADIHPAELPDWVRVSDVLVGGTLVFDTGEKAVLLGVVWPSRGQPAAKDAMRLIKDQTRGRQISVLHDTSSFGVRRRDGLGRLVVYATPEPDGRDLAGELIFQGYGWLDRAVRFARRDDYVRQEDAAWRAGRGIWERFKGDEGQRKVVTGRHADQYHSPKCPHVKHMTGVMEMPINEAKDRRLTPCSEYRDKATTKKTDTEERSE